MFNFFGVALVELHARCILCLEKIQDGLEERAPQFPVCQFWVEREMFYPSNASSVHGDPFNPADFDGVSFCTASAYHVGHGAVPMSIGQIIEWGPPIVSSPF